MRTGACAVQQALTSEAAAALKHALSLARRRGHAQVTPLHVAATLLGSGGLFRRACVRSHPRHRGSHPLHCRALELCFNVALNRLPTVPPGPLCPPSGPAFSNALVAALKRAQAHQRRGGATADQHQMQQQQQEPPAVPVKVELEQLVISILDDPSVSRVMREAGFSSTCVKSSLEEDASSPPSLWPPSQAPPLPFSQEEDLGLLLDVLLGRKNKLRGNAVVVGDSVSYAELLVAELMSRVERGGEEVPDELRSAQWVKLQLSHLASRAEVEMEVAQFRKKVSSLVSWGGDGGRAIIYVGDLRWAIHEHAAAGESCHLIVAEVGRLLSDLRAASGGKVWLVAIADLQTYLKWKRRHPLLQLQWALQAVSIPSGGPALSLHVSSEGNSRGSPPLYPVELKPRLPQEGEDRSEKLVCCGVCASSFEREALSATSPVFSHSGGARDGSHGSEKRGEDVLVELSRKWNWICRGLRHESARSSGVPSFHATFCDRLAAANSRSRLASPVLPTGVSSQGNLSSLFLDSATATWASNVKTRLALATGGSLSSDSATSGDQNRMTRASPEMPGRRDLWRLLADNVPWQSPETTGAVAAALSETRHDEKKNGTWLLLRGTDRVGKRRLCLAIGEFFCGSAPDRLVRIDVNEAEASAELLVDAALRSDPSSVFLIEDVDCADADFLRALSEIHGGDGCRDARRAVFVLCTSSHGMPELFPSREEGRVIAMRFRAESPSPAELTKRKLAFPSDEASPRKPKNPRKGVLALDLNLSPGDAESEEDEEAVPSDLTHEPSSDGFLGSIRHGFVVDMGPERRRRMAEHFRSKLGRSFEDAAPPGSLLSVDAAAAEELAAASGSFLDSLFDEWLRQVFRASLRPLEKPGTCVGLWVDGGASTGAPAEAGFHGSALPMRIPCESGNDTRERERGRGRY